MINLAKVLTGKPYLVLEKIYFYQPTVEEVVEMTETAYWSALNVWTIKRKEMIEHETAQSRQMDDYEVWRASVFSTPVFRQMLVQSCAILLKEKVEFFDISGTIYIGEKASGVILDATFYLLMREICERMIPSSASDAGQQYRETDNMSERERQLIEKMKKAEQQVDAIKNPDKHPEDALGNRILGLVAVGGYTFEQVYNMTMLQFNLLLKKYVDIQTFELRTQLSPYISSDDGQKNTFWLE